MKFNIFLKNEALNILSFSDVLCDLLKNKNEPHLKIFKYLQKNYWNISIFEQENKVICAYIE